MRVLLVEDEGKLAALVARGITERGDVVDVVGTGSEALASAGGGEYDVILLDVGLPDLDGFDVCRRMRSARIWTPVLMLTARTAVADRIAGLDSGADDYVAKPFAFQELLARMRALARRGPVPRPAELEVGSLRLDPAARRAWRGATEVSLSTREFTLLETLMRRPGQVLTREQLLGSVWGDNSDVASNVVDVYVRYLRAKIDRPFGISSLHTVRGSGLSAHWGTPVIGGHPVRWPLRTRVALAFLGATGVALVVLGAFVHVRLSAALEDRLRDTVTAEADGLEAVAGPRRLRAVQALGGEVQAQALTAQGDVRASSRLVAGPLIEPAPDDGTGDTEPGWHEGTVTVFDDDAATEGHHDPERESFLTLVRHTDDGFLVVGTSRDDVDEALAALRNQLLIAGPLALAVTGGLGYLVAGAGLRPIERIRARAATISARSAGERLPLPQADDELRRLAVTLNAMLERLDDGLQRERRFVAEASHDLRTPLTLMRTEIELALAQPRPPQDLAQALHSLDDEVRRLIALADDLLERAGAEEGGLPIEARPVELVALTTRVADRFHSAAGDRTIRVSAARPIAVQGDAARLDRALSNLVDNALRHGAGDITIEVRASSGGAALTVADEGAGFARGTTSQPRGSGLGLTIVREIVRAHGGTVEVTRADARTRIRMELASPRD